MWVAGVGGVREDKPRSRWRCRDRVGWETLSFGTAQGMTKIRQEVGLS